MKKVILSLLFMLSQPTFASGTWLICAAKDSSGEAIILGSADGTNLYLSDLKISKFEVETNPLRLKLHKDLGYIFTASLALPNPDRNLALVLVPIKRPNMLGGTARLSILMGGNTLAEMDCYSNSN